MTPNKRILVSGTRDMAQLVKPCQHEYQVQIPSTHMKDKYSSMCVLTLELGR